MGRSRTRGLIGLSAAVLLVLGLTGCADPPAPTGARTESAPAGQAESDDVTAERARLGSEERALVEAQEWCVVQTDERLGSMGPPIRLDIKGQPVFICCKGCRRKAEADPDGTLARVAELKAKAKAERVVRRVGGVNDGR